MSTYLRDTTLDDPQNLYDIWCVTLWDARANLITKHGFPSGNDLILRLVTDSMKLCPPNPDFLQARDALLLADRVYTGGGNQSEIWAAFAKRGMGWGASVPPNSSAHITGVVESFNPPPQGEVEFHYRQRCLLVSGYRGRWDNLHWL